METIHLNQSLIQQTQIYTPSELRNELSKLETPWTRLEHRLEEDYQ